MRTVRDAKAMAKSLRTELLSRAQVDLSHGECLEIVARQFGVDNWNILSAKTQDDRPEEPPRWRAAFASTTTIPVLRIFSVPTAKQFYLDFLDFTLDFGGPATGEAAAPCYGQVSRPGTTLQLTEQPYEPGPGATVDIWLAGLADLRQELLARDLGVFGPAFGVPPILEMHWAARVLILPDPFGNHLRLSEPLDPADRAHLPWWARAEPAQPSSFE